MPSDTKAKVEKKENERRDKPSLKRNYTQKTLKVLFSLSGNQCAHPECTNTLIEPATEQSDALVTGHICHIYAISVKGPRGKDSLTEEELNSPDNLILFCRHHHGIVDGQHETYPADLLKNWKRAHEVEMQRRLSANFDSISPEVFAQPYFPTSLVDQKIDEEIAVLRKSRFFAEFDRVGVSLALGRRLAIGELSGGTDTVRSRALSWCARLLSRTDELDKAEEYLRLANTLGNGCDINIADAFIKSQKGDKSAALKALAHINSSSARSAALMVVAHHEGAQSALDWLEKTQIGASGLDADGKLFLLTKQLDLAQWEAAEQTLKVLSDQDLTEAPLLHHMLAKTRLLSTVPDEFRGVVLNQVPFQAADFPLASDEAAMLARREAQRHFVESVNISRSLNFPRAAKINDEYALWIELKDPETSVNGRTRLENSLRDPASALGLVPLALQFGIKLDLVAVEREIERQITLNGGIIADAATARFAIAFTQKSPSAVASYIAQHYDALSQYVDQKAIRFLQIEMLSRAGLHEKANEKLDSLRREGLSEGEEERLRMIIEEAQGADPVSLRKAQFNATGSLTDLIVLVGELESKGVWDELCEYGRILFERTRSVGDAERLAVALSNSRRTAELLEIFSGCCDLRRQSQHLQLCYCWALYHEGKLLEARTELASLEDQSDQENYRALFVNIRIMLGDWPSLSAFVADEYVARDNRSARELIEIAQLAHNLGSPRARDLTSAAAEKGHGDAAVLSAAYFLASTAGWEGSEEVARWLQRAAELSGDDGPIKLMTFKELVERKPEWDRRESETWRMLSHGETPMFLAGQALHRSLVKLMLFPAIANTLQRDPRRRGMIPAYCGTRQLSQSFEATTIGIDATALLTLSLLDVLDEALDTFDTVFVPHSTLAWLFEEKQKATFHQPSRIRDARQIHDLLRMGRLERLVPSSVADADLSAQVGDELALLIAEAEKPRDGDDRQRIVVRPSPVYRRGSLMHEEADLTEHASVVSSCLSIVAKLRLKGQLTAAEEKKAHAYLQLCEKPWSQEPEIADSAILYLDHVAISYFLHIGILEKLQEAGFTVIASPGEVAESDALITYEGISDKVNNAIERIRSALNVRIESGRIKVGARHRRPEADGDPIYEHPTVGTIALAAVCDAVICDDRFVNQHPHVVDDGVQALMLSTLDLLDALVARGSITAERCLECRTLLRRAGYVLVPVRDDELTQYLDASPVVDGKFREAAELKAVRENILCMRMSNWLQLPKEAPWLESTLKTFVRVLKNLWESGADPSTVTVLSDWIVDLVDIRGWAHRFTSEAGDNLVNIGRGAHILMLLSPPLNGNREIKEAYWEWVEDRVLAPVKEQFPDLYARIVEWEKGQVETVVDMNLDQEGDHAE